MHCSEVFCTDYTLCNIEVVATVRMVGVPALTTLISGNKGSLRQSPLTARPLYLHLDPTRKIPVCLPWSLPCSFQNFRFQLSPLQQTAHRLCLEMMAVTCPSPIPAKGMRHIVLRTHQVVEVLVRRAPNGFGDL